MGKRSLTAGCVTGTGLWPAVTRVLLLGLAVALPVLWSFATAAPSRGEPGSRGRAADGVRVSSAGGKVVVVRGSRGPSGRRGRRGRRGPPGQLDPAVSAKIADATSKILESAIALLKRPGGSPVAGLDIAEGSITTSQLADGAVTSAKIADGAVTGTKIATGGVGAAQLLAGAVGGPALADSSVTSAKIADGSVEIVDISPAVWSDNISQSGSLAVRPTAASANEGYLYFAEDDSGGRLYRSNGTSWSPLSPSLGQSQAGSLWATVQQRSAFIQDTAMTASDRYAFTEAGGLKRNGASTATSGAAFRFDPADYPSSTSLMVQASMLTNGLAAPAGTYSIGLFPVTSAGGGDQQVLTAGAPAGATADFTNPPASSALVRASAQFAATSVPAGYYVIGIANSVAWTSTTNSTFDITAALQFKLE